MMALQRTNCSIMDRTIIKRRKDLLHRRNLLNEIHFTHVNLARALRAMVPRELSGRLGRALKGQHDHDEKARQVLADLGMDLGMPPGPCVCADSMAVLAALRYADRVDRGDAHRDVGIISALREVRVFVIRLWGALLDGIEQEQGRIGMFQRILRLQEEEADQHRDLVRLAGMLSGESDGGSLKRTA